MYHYALQLRFKTGVTGVSRIGIQYPYKFQALQSYEKLAQVYSGHRFSITIEPGSKTLRLKLCSDHNGEILTYNALLYKPSELAKLMATGNSAQPMEFVHIYTEANATLVAKPFGQEQFFAISRYEVIGAVGF